MIFKSCSLFPVVKEWSSRMYWLKRIHFGGEVVRGLTSTSRGCCGPLDTDRLDTRNGLLESPRVP